MVAVSLFPRIPHLRHVLPHRITPACLFIQILGETFTCQQAWKCRYAEKPKLSRVTSPSFYSATSPNFAWDHHLFVVIEPCLCSSTLPSWKFTIEFYFSPSSSSCFIRFISVGQAETLTSATIHPTKPLQRFNWRYLTTLVLSPPRVFESCISFM